MRLRTLALSLAAALGIAMLGFAPTASATMAQCTVGHFCVWEDGGFQGHFGAVTVGHPDLRTAINGFVFQDRISSVWNRTGHIWCTYKDINYNGGVHSWNPNESQSHLGGIGWGDTISSLKPC